MTILGSRIQPEAFFAYPSQPTTLSEIATNAIKGINDSGVCKVTGWEELRAGGVVIIEQICEAISNADLLIADITGLNTNVLFEVGFAIGKSKRIWLTIDKTRKDQWSQFETFSILKSVGIAKYEGSPDIIREFLDQQPFLSLEKVLIDPRGLVLDEFPAKPKIIYLQDGAARDDGMAITDALTSQKKCELYPLNPKESPESSLPLLLPHFRDCTGVVAHFLSPAREGSEMHNARYALLAGVAFGLGKKIVLIAESDFSAPLDYRQLLRPYASAMEARTITKKWISELVLEHEATQSKEFSLVHQEKRADELAKIQVGDHIAERESDSLTEDYFIETSPYLEAKNREFSIVLGRRGAGKSAILLKLASALKADTRCLVCTLALSANDMEALIRLIGQINQKDRKGYTIEAIWKLVILSEIARQFVDRLGNHSRSSWSTEELDFVDWTERNFPWILEEIPIRLERIVREFGGDRPPLDMDGSLEQFQQGLSERLHIGPLKELRAKLGKALKRKKEVRVLVDNLDVAWGRGKDVPLYSEVLHDLLSVSADLVREYRKDTNRMDSINLFLTVALRSDIFLTVREFSPEPDKLPVVDVMWDDADLLLRVLDERFRASRKNIDAKEFWDRFFPATYGDLPIREYLLKVTLPKPRDIVYLANSAVQIAITRRHQKVMEQDVEKAVDQYSQFAFESLAVESDIFFPQFRAFGELIFGEVAQVVNRSELETALLKVEVESSATASVIDQLCKFGFLGVEINEQEFRYIYNPFDAKRLLLRADRYAIKTGKPARYLMHPAFHSYLEPVVQ